MYKTCEVEGCECLAESSGQLGRKVKNELATRYCKRHLTRLMRNGTLDLSRPYERGTKEERFWRYVDKRSNDECWTWTADCSRGGYGSIWDKETNRNVSAHRYSYELHNGPIEKGKHILHSCDNKKCVNPNHLRPGTVKENVKDAVERGQKKPMQALFGEQNPKSKLTLEQVRFIRQHPEMKHTELADLFGLSPNCIRGVRIGRTWVGIE